MLLSLLLLSSSALAAITSCPGGSKNGEKWNEGSFVKECRIGDNGYAIVVVGCLTRRRTTIPLGEKAVEDKQLISCLAAEGGGARIEMGPAPSASASEGKVRAQVMMKCDGKYEDGEKYTDGNFVKQCTASTYSAATKIVACLSPLKKEVAIGAAINEGRIKFSCVAVPGGAKVETEPLRSSSSQQSSAGESLMKCHEKYQNGQKYKEGNFVKECISTASSWFISVVACIAPSTKEIAVGAKLEEEGFVYSCVQKGQSYGLEMERAAPSKAGCEDGKYQKDQTFRSTNARFVLKCLDEYGTTEIIGCVTDEGKEVKVGEELVIGMFKNRCYKEEKGGAIRFSKEHNGGMRPAVMQKGCGQYKVGTPIISTDGKFKFECVADGKIDFIGCIVEGDKIVKGDTVQTIGDWIYDCKSTSNGGATIARRPLKM